MKNLVEMKIKPMRLHRSDVAKLLGVSETTIKRRVKNELGFPTPMKDGAGRAAHVYFKTADVEAYIAKQFGQPEAIAA